MADLLEAAARTSRSVGENARWHVRDEHPPRLPKGVLPAATRVEEAWVILYIDADAGERAAVWPLEELTLADRARLAEMSLVVAIGVGQTIILEGDRPEALCVIVAGSARVEVQGRAIATLGPGSLVGEMSPPAGWRVAPVRPDPATARRHMSGRAS